jgi:hypothetical protein
LQLERQAERWLSIVPVHIRPANVPRLAANVPRLALRGARSTLQMTGCFVYEKIWIKISCSFSKNNVARAGQPNMCARGHAIHDDHKTKHRNVVCYFRWHSFAFTPLSRSRLERLRAGILE